MGVLPTKDGDKPQRLDCANSRAQEPTKSNRLCNKGRRANHWNGVCSVCILYVDMHLLEVSGDGRPHESLPSCVWKKFEHFDQLHIRWQNATLLLFYLLLTFHNCGGFPTKLLLVDALHVEQRRESSLNVFDFLFERLTRDSTDIHGVRSNRPPKVVMDAAGWNPITGTIPLNPISASLLKQFLCVPFLVDSKLNCFNYNYQ